MANPPKPTARPPRAPKGEDPAVTIANQARELDNIIERVAALVKERDEANIAHNRAVLALAQRDEDIASLNETIAVKNRHLQNMAAVNERATGWQDCAREVFTELLGKS